MASSLRRCRNWLYPSQFKGKWQQTFNEQQAMEALKKAAASREEHSPGATLLSALITSFSSYGCDPNPSAYAFIINHLFQRSLFSQLSPVLNRLERVEKFDPPERIFIDLIRSYGDAGMFQEAVSLFYRIPRFRCAPTVRSLNALLTVLCKKEDNVVSIYDVLMRSLDMNIRLEYTTFRILIKALCRYGKLNSAIELFRMMDLEVYGCTRDSNLYSVILASLCKHASSGEVLSFLQEMRKEGCSPNQREYGNVINGLVKEGKAKDALDVLNKMKLDGIKPDTVVYTNVLDGVLLAGDFAKGEELFDEMLIMGVVPDIFTYSVYIKGLCKQGDFDGAFDMLVHMEQAGCTPNAITYSTVMGELCKVGNLTRARDLIRMMASKGVQGNLHIYRFLIDGLVSEGDTFAAFSLLEEMLRIGFVPRCKTLDSLVIGLCECQLFSEALQVLEEMVRRSAAPNLRAWQSLILAMELDMESIEAHLMQVHGCEISVPWKCLNPDLKSLREQLMIGNGIHHLSLIAKASAPDEQFR